MFFLYWSCSITSVIGKAALDLYEKMSFKTFFQKPFTKLTEFWKRLGVIGILLFCFCGFAVCFWRIFFILLSYLLSCSGENEGYFVNSFV